MKTTEVVSEHPPATATNLREVLGAASAGLGTLAFILPAVHLFYPASASMVTTGQLVIGSTGLLAGVVSIFARSKGGWTATMVGIVLSLLGLAYAIFMILAWSSG